MSVSEAHKRASKKWNEARDQITIRPDREHGSAIRAAAAAAGLTVQRFILAAVDEVLRGTNTVERISASTAIMKQLAEVNGLILAATHDLELTDILKDHYDNYHFEETIVDDDIYFAYKLMPGEATTRNAIRLLHIMGYDDDLVKEAEDMAKDYGKADRQYV